MKKILFLFVIFTFLLVKSSFSQVKNDTLSKYVGTYYLVKPNTDSTIKYDYITFYMKDNTLYCKRDFLFVGGTIDRGAKHEDYEVVEMNSKQETITLKYMENKSVYKFRTNKKGNLELVIMEDVLIYERR